MVAGADPFVPDGVAWVPVSPRLAGARRLVTSLAFGVPALGEVVLSFWWVWAWSFVAGLVLLWAWAWWLIGRQVPAWGYAEREDDLLVRRGVMIRRLSVVPYGRMQYVEVGSGPVQRMFGLSTVQLHTASPSSDAAIPGLVPAEAARLRDRLSSRGEARLAGL